MSRLRGLFVAIVTFIMISLLLHPLYAQDLSGRIKGTLTFSPFYGLLTPGPPLQRLIQTGSERVPQLVGLTTQLDLGLDFPGISLDGTFAFTNVGMTLAWLSGDATFVADERGQKRVTQKRTVAQNDFIKIMRSFPAQVRAGEEFEVMILIEALQLIPAGTPIEVIEEYPQGWIIEPIEPMGAVITSSAMRWTIVTLDGPGSRAIIRYNVQVPKDAPLGSVTVKGTVRSPLFSPLDFSDELEVTAGPPALPGQIRLKQDIIFSALVRSGVLADPIGFRLMNLRAQVTLPQGPTLLNFLSIQNEGTAQTPSLTWRDTMQLSGQTSGGVNTRVTLRFSDDAGMPLAFDGGRLQISTLPLSSNLSLRTLIDFDAKKVLRLQLIPNLITEVQDTQVSIQGNFKINEQLQIEDLSVGIRFFNKLVDGIFQVSSSYGTLSYDADDDGVEEEHFDLISRIVLWRSAIDKLDIRSTILFRPALYDTDNDGADEKTAEAKLVRYDLRIRRSLEDVFLTGRILLTAPTTSPDPLKLTLVSLDMTVIQGNLRFGAGTRLTFNPLNFQATLSLTVNF